MGEMGRQLANLVRVGKILQLDEANARVKVSTAGLTTDWLPWGAARAGTTRKGSMPSIGEQVMLFSPFGDLSQAVVGFSLYQDDHPAPTTSKDQETAVFPDGTAVEYDSASNTLTVTVAGAGNVIINCKVATVNADTSVTLDTPQTTLTGNLTVQGATVVQGITSRGKNISDTHTHTGVVPGGGSTGAVN